jgi:hypothetical protein
MSDLVADLGAPDSHCISFYMTTGIHLAAKFPLGNVIITRNAWCSIPQEEMLVGLTRHQSGDWGDLDEHDWTQNNLALKQGRSIWSVYYTSLGLRFWVITESDRNSTTVKLPEDP